jgi:diguanylate cyclase (GGDEF)-like protein
MRLLRATHLRPTSLFERDRPPRLVLRFAVVLSLSLGIASALILVIVRVHATGQAERAAIAHAELVASTLVEGEITADDVAAPVSRARRAELDAVFRPEVLGPGMVDVSIVRDDGLVTYSTDGRRVGTHADRALADETRGGSIVSAVSETPAGQAGNKTLETMAPLGRGSSRGALVIAQGYGQVEDAARAAQLRVGAVLEGLLVLLVLVLVPLLARVTRRIERQIERIHAQAYYDDLTGLPNRAHLREALDHALDRAAAPHRSLGVLLLDLDRFREINDTLGHDAGDELLVEVATRLRREVGSERLLARLAADQFVVVLELAREEDGRELACAVRRALEPATVVAGLTLTTECTIGIAVYPEDGQDTETLLRHAEVATYTAKERRAEVLRYQRADDPHDPVRLALVNELRGIGERGELELHYQPKVDLATGLVVGYEALAYWQHPSRGLLPPGMFVPIAERSGGIRHLTRAALGAALLQLREWSTLRPSLTVAVNLSAIDLLDPELPDMIRDLLRSAGVDARRLCIELTESAVIADPERARSVLDHIAATGAAISVDDFGTGHSSFAYLKHLPVTELKVDRSFVAGIAGSAHDRAIVEAAIHLGHSFGLEVVAEGVETRESHELLRSLGCDRAQGYLYGRPQPTEVVTALLTSGDLEAA